MFKAVESFEVVVYSDEKWKWKRKRKWKYASTDERRQCPPLQLAFVRLQTWRMRNFTLCQLAYTLSCVLTMHAAQLWPLSCRLVTVKTDFYAVAANITNTLSFVSIQPSVLGTQLLVLHCILVARASCHSCALVEAVISGEFSLLAAGIPCRHCRLCLAVGAKNFASQFYEYACLGRHGAARSRSARLAFNFYINWWLTRVQLFQTGTPGKMSRAVKWSSLRFSHLVGRALVSLTGDKSDVPGASDSDNSWSFAHTYTFIQESTDCRWIEGA